MMTFLAFYAIRNSEMYIKGIFYIVRSVKDISFVLEFSSVFFIHNLFFSLMLTRNIDFICYSCSFILKKEL